MATVSPFRFAGLKHYTGEQVAIQESFATYLSYRPFTPEFVSSLAAVLEAYLKVPCSFARVDQRPLSSGELNALLPSPACILVIGAAPTEHKILCELDQGLAAFAIDRLLGGSGDSGRIQRPLTEIEEGVLSFIILKALGEFQTAWRTGAELALTLDRFASSAAEIRDIVDAEGLFHLVGVRVAAGSCMGYARLLLPAGLITRSFTSPPDQGAASSFELAHIRGLLGALGDVRIEGRLEIATLDLGPEDIANLESGDIIILENHAVTTGPSGIEGAVFVRLGDGQNGGLRGRVVVEGDQPRLEILEIVVQERPPEGTMNEIDSGAPGDGAADDNLRETQGLLRDVPAPVIVELGRIRLNTAQVVRMRTGQILRLPRGPNDPVDLVVNGKLFARGELIEVDGELGVRLLQVVGGG